MDTMIRRARMGERRLQTVLLLLGVLALGPAAVAAQDAVGVFASGGLAAPVGDFGDEIGEEAGLAQWGGLLALEVAVPIRAAPGLAWISTLEGATFGVDEDFVQAFASDVPELEVELGRYWTALGFTGLGYSTDIGPGLRVRGVGQFGAGFFKSPSGQFTFGGEGLELVTNWEAAHGWSAGLGATVNDRFTLDARYVTLINTEITGEVRYQNFTEELRGDQPVSWVQVTAGVRVR